MIIWLVKRRICKRIAALRHGIASLNKEGRERLLTAFEQVNESFGLLFSHLFGGGEAKLVLVESDDPLEAGLEIMCQPPGKKLSTLSLLSGGEQTLTALALIFAVLRSARRDDPPHPDTVFDHHAPCRHHEPNGPFVWCDHGRAGRVATGVCGFEEGRRDGCVIRIK